MVYRNGGGVVWLQTAYASITIEAPDHACFEEEEWVGGDSTWQRARRTNRWSGGVRGGSSPERSDDDDGVSPWRAMLGLSPEIKGLSDAQ